MRLNSQRRQRDSLCHRTSVELDCRNLTSSIVTNVNRLDTKMDGRKNLVGTVAAGVNHGKEMMKDTVVGKSST